MSPKKIKNNKFIYFAIFDNFKLKVSYVGSIVRAMNSKDILKILIEKDEVANLHDVS